MNGTFTGPGGTQYRHIGCGPLGRVGLANLGDGRFRVRVEPGVTASAPLADVFEGWNQPTSENNRFSLVVEGEAAADEAVEYALKAVGAPAPSRHEETGGFPPSSLARARELARELAETLAEIRG